MRSNDAPLLLDLTRLIWRRWEGKQLTGIDRVCLAYLEHFAPVAQAVVHHRRFRGILDRNASAALFELVSTTTNGFKSQLAAGFLRHFRGSVRDGGGRPYLNIGHTGLDSRGFVDWVGEADVRPVYFVHDLIPITHPQFCRRGEDGRHRRRMRTVLTTGHGVIGNSQATLNELASFACAEELPRLPGVAAWLGCTVFVTPPAAEQPSASPTFVVLGTIEARKNHSLLLKVWKKLVHRLGPLAPRLLIIGKRGWEAEPVFEALDRDETLRGYVVELNDCTDEEVASHLMSAQALLFPSQAEGYGLPLVEALSLGVPVIVSDLPVFREIGQRIPTFLPADDGQAWEAAILDFAREDSAARTAQLERVKSFRTPSWKAHFEAVEKWLSVLPS